MTPSGEGKRSVGYGYGVAAAVFVIGVLLMVVPSLRVGLGTIYEDPAKVHIEERTVEKTAADGSVTREKSTSPRSDPLVEGLLSPGGVLFVRLALVILVAYLSGAIAFHLARGQFPIKLGPVEMHRQVEVDQQLKDLIATTAKASSNSVSELAGRFVAMRDTTSSTVRDITEALKQLDERISRVAASQGVLLVGDESTAAPERPTSSDIAAGMERRAAGRKDVQQRQR